MQDWYPAARFHNAIFAHIFNSSYAYMQYYYMNRIFNFGLGKIKCGI